MRLSDLKTKDKCVVIKVKGHGGFRKRIVEMGFIKGKVVEVLLNAPLMDPVKYKVMGYEISLRRAEAELIEVMSMEEAREYELAHADENDAKNSLSCDKDEVEDSNERLLRIAAMKKRRVINVALVGNPNCGKTSLFNYVSGAHERVGNYSGVTVDAKEGTAFFEGYEFNMVDLPGTYSLTAYSPEELYVRRQILDFTPDVVLNVVDASNLERNLYLTTQLVDMHLRMICALNMYDEFEMRGDSVNAEKLGQLFGVPMVPTVFRSGRGVDLLFHIIINLYEGVDFLDKDGNINPEVAHDLQEWHKTYEKHHGGHHEEDFAHGMRPNNSVARHIHLNHGKYIERGIQAVKDELRNNEEIRHKYSTRYLAIKLLEHDKEAEKLVEQLPNKAQLLAIRDQQTKEIEHETHDDIETSIMNAKYSFIHGALHEAQFKEGKKVDTYQLTHTLDRLITSRYLGFPMFLLLLYVMFQATFTLGQYPMDWIDSLVDCFGNFVSVTLPSGMLKDLISDGIISGVGSVIVFLPQILILYAFISFMEDSGYMARAAFIMDKLMHKMGLHGKSFIPLIMGFGCNVPAVMATRTIESRRSRLITMLIIPFMSCSARLPIYIMITGAFFAVKYQSLVMISLYVIGILIAVVASKILSRYVIRGDDTPFVMELPPYRFPSAKAICRHTWEKCKQYLKKMGGIILTASIIVWALGYFPHHEGLTLQQQKEQSCIGMIGKTIEPVFRPQGFNWKLDVGLLSGVGAKEIVASTISVLYAGEESVQEDTSKYSTLQRAMQKDGIGQLEAFVFLLFVLIYFPCVATIAAIRNETRSTGWAVFTAVYTTIAAWIITAIVYQVALLF